MSEFRPIDGAARRRIGVLAVVVPLAFLAGVLLAAYLIRTRHLPGFVAAAAPVPVAATAPTALSLSPVPAALDPATLSARATALAGQLAALEARVRAGSDDAAASGAQAGRAEALLILAATRRALDRGTPLGYLDGALGQRFAAQQAPVETIRAAARQPVLLEDLRFGLDTLADASGDDEGWRATLAREFGNLVVLRHADLPAPAPIDRLATARRLLDAGRVESARAQIASLPGPRRAAWLTAANRYVAARQALDALERAALTAPQAPSY